MSRLIGTNQLLNSDYPIQVKAKLSHYHIQYCHAAAQCIILVFINFKILHKETGNVDA